MAQSLTHCPFPFAVLSLGIKERERSNDFSSDFSHPSRNHTRNRGLWQFSLATLPWFQALAVVCIDMQISCHRSPQRRQERTTQVR